MYILKNAIVSITRNKGRNTLIGIIIIVIACSTTVSLAIRNSSDSLIKSYENKSDIEATIGIDRENMKERIKPNTNKSSSNQDELRKKFKEVSNISIEDIKKYGDSDYVKNYHYSISIGVNAKKITKVSSTSNEDNFGPRGPKFKNEFKEQTTSDFTLVGYSSVNAMSDFISGKYSITDGEVSDDIESNTCVINSELATQNNIKVKDKITFVDPDNSKNTITLEVTGIFDEKSENNDKMDMFTSSANTIITNTNVISKLTSKNSSISTKISPTFILKSKDDIELFTKEVKEKGLSEYLSVSTNIDNIKSATSTISNVKTFATTFLIITLIVGGIVLFIINMINIRERKYEIGVLRTIGMKKSHLTIQFMSELLMIALVGLLVGAIIGSLISVPVSNNLLQNEITSSKEQTENIDKNFGRSSERNFPAPNRRINGVAQVQAFNSINAAVDLKVLIELLGIGIVLTVVSSTSAVLSIQKFSPLTILKERS